MSFQGKSPSLKRTRYTPQSVDPVNPQEGDFFYSDGTPRIAGPWVYQGGAWQQVQTSGALSTVNDLTFIPQSSDPSTATGKVFYADGTSRAEGLWIYDGTQWVQISGNNRTAEFAFKDYYQVRLASIGVNIPLSNIFANGSNALDGVILVNNDLVLIKDQAIDSENGIYQIGLSGPPVRATGATTFSDLNYSAVIVNLGTVNINTTWFQNTVLTSFAGQSWTATPSGFSFVVPENITTINVTGCGGGGAGGSGGGIQSSGSNSWGGGGGAGGSGATIVTTNIAVTPGETITVALGDGGKRATGTTTSAARAPNGGNGTQTTITCLSGTYRFPGAVGGLGGFNTSLGVPNPAGADGRSGNADYIAGDSTTIGGYAGDGSTSGLTPAALDGQASIYAAGGASSTGIRGGGGGGGGASIAAGATGGVGTSGGYTVTTPTSIYAGADASKGAGGGGGGGQGATAGSVGGRVGSTSGMGGPGYVRISW